MKSPEISSIEKPEPVTETGSIESNITYNQNAGTFTPNDETFTGNTSELPRVDIENSGEKIPEGKELLEAVFTPNGETFTGNSSETPEAEIRRNEQIDEVRKKLESVSKDDSDPDQVEELVEDPELLREAIGDKEAEEIIREYKHAKQVYELLEKFSKVEITYIIINGILPDGSRLKTESGDALSMDEAKRYAKDFKEGKSVAAVIKKIVIKTIKIVAKIVAKVVVTAIKVGARIAVGVAGFIAGLFGGGGGGSSGSK